MQSTRSVLSNAPVFADVPAKDISRARDFYENTLGLHVQDVEENRFTVRGGHGTQFMVYQSDAIDPGTVLTFQVAHVRDAIVDLKGHGVAFEEFDMPGMKTVEGVADFGPGRKMAWFKDSEGNLLSIGGN